MAESVTTTTPSARASLASATYAAEHATGSGRLAELAKLYEVLDRAIEEADEASAELYKAHEALLPPQPEALRCQKGDWTAIGVYHRDGFIGDDQDDDIVTVRRFHAGNKEIYSATGANKAFVKRGEEVIAAWDSWWAVNRALYEGIGIPASNDLCNDLIKAQTAILQRMAKEPATTLADLKAKARVIAQLSSPGDNYVSTKLMWSLVGDLAPND